MFMNESSPVTRLELVCSQKPRPSVQKGPKGNQFWKRDVHHIAREKKTLCGIDASDWLAFAKFTPQAADDPNLCTRCKSALSSIAATTVETTGLLSLDDLIGLTKGCSYDGGFDREIGQIGCCLDVK